MSMCLSFQTAIIPAFQEHEYFKSTREEVILSNECYDDMQVCLMCEMMLDGVCTLLEHKQNTP